MNLNKFRNFGDLLLCDLPGEITLEELQSQIALEYGQAMVVNVRRADNQVMGNILKYVWKRHWLYFDGQRLTEDNKKIKE
ncbi:U11/U12 small nuclear ribonucleoprotein 25 kDa protein-like [Dreissena polymorpha]|uniref:U11/U12 small nuclear ribonucleoprotein 25 kDa protein-like n=1 Tax=Dreissena polymorpha TaxID=45954 RepID=UPI002264D4A8|nr:U11/U12 small nuclear ribonucleoprotein 25 kDa protein-like [Dreissena polymorpha]